MPILTLLLPYVSELGPPAFRRAFVKLIPFADVQRVVEMVEMMDKTSHDIVRYKESSNLVADEQVGGEKDMCGLRLPAGNIGHPHGSYN